MWEGAAEGLCGGLVASTYGSPVGTVTFLFTDVEGSTARGTLIIRRFDGSARHDEIVRKAIEREKGYIFSLAAMVLRRRFNLRGLLFVRC